MEHVLDFRGHDGEPSGLHPIAEIFNFPRATMFSAVV